MIEPGGEPNPSDQFEPNRRPFGNRRATWGDDPEEIQASEVVEEFSSDEEIQRNWVDHPAFAPFKVVWRFIQRSGKRIAVTIGGFAVLLAGVALLVLPARAGSSIFLGLGILATEYVWAQRMLTYARQKAEQAKDAVLRKNKAKDEKKPAADQPPDSAWPGRILIGTSSWTDPTLVKDGNFYPPEAKTPEARLRFYASRFPLVEVDSTYYFPPSEENSVRWLERTPPDFTFNIKAYSLLTNHPTKPESIYKDLRDSAPDNKRFIYRDDLPDTAVEEVWQRFRDALMPLHSAGKLGADRSSSSRSGS